jgi:hypothetical protein
MIDHDGLPVAALIAGEDHPPDRPTAGVATSRPYAAFRSIPL